MDLEEYYARTKILILGGAGFIGSNLAKAFVNFGAKVTIVDGFVQHTGASIGNIKSFLSQIDLYDCRVENLDRLPELVNTSDLIIDSMALTAHNFGVEYPILDIQLNLLSHLHLISSLKIAQNKKIIYLGSRGQYGNIKESVITEETPQNPVDPQGINKMAAESYFKIYARRYGFKGVSLRITNCFGENQKVSGNDIGLIGSFIRDILSEKPVEIYGNEERKKDLIYVKDLVKIILELSVFDLNDFEVYNIAGLRVSLKSILDTIIENTGKGCYVIKPFPQAVKNIDVGEAEFSDRKMRDKLGKLKLHDLSSSLTNTIKYFQNQIHGEKKK